MKRFPILMVPALLVATPVSAQPASVEPQPTVAAQAAQVAPAVAEKPKKVCRKTEITGRRIASSVCHTREEWAAVDAADKEAARKFTDDIMRNGSRGGGGTDSSGGMASNGLMGLGSP